MIITNTSTRMFGQAEDRLSMTETLLTLEEEEEVVVVVVVVVVLVEFPPANPPGGTSPGPPIPPPVLPIFTEYSKMYCAILLKW